MSPLEDGDPDCLERLCGPVGPIPPPRTMIVAAHPDDEIIGAGGRLARLGPAARIAYATDGAPADGADARARGFDSVEDYASARQAEALSALALAGISSGQTRGLGFSDQRLAFEMAGLTRRLAELWDREVPEAAVIHAYEGGHPDHDAVAFAARHAVELLRRDGAPAPALIEMTSYHQSASGMRAGAFLPGGAGEREVALGPAERELKLRMLSAHWTQLATLEPFMAAIGSERFRPAPVYDFSLPPHAGPLWHERYSWSVTGARWRNLALAAAAELKLEKPKAGARCV